MISQFMGVEEPVEGGPFMLTNLAKIVFYFYVRVYKKKKGFDIVFGC